MTEFEVEVHMFAESRCQANGAPLDELELRLWVSFSLENRTKILMETLLNLVEILPKGVEDVGCWVGQDQIHHVGLGGMWLEFICLCKCKWANILSDF